DIDEVVSALRCRRSNSTCEGAATITSLNIQAPAEPSEAMAKEVVGNTTGSLAETELTGYCRGPEIHGDDKTTTRHIFH
ncbi:hypothetical protein ATANTOWER_003813, partial [Ataeniobius toweri]|nr:hypothetical protein [Ataeniobius toweri]